MQQLLDIFYAPGLFFLGFDPFLKGAHALLVLRGPARLA